MKAVSYYDSPLGPILLAADGESLTGLWFVGQKYIPREYLEMAPSSDPINIFMETKLWLNRYFSGEQPDISQLSLAPSGSAFRMRVWELLREIPYGKTCSYSDLAKILEAESEKKMSAQAVGGAVGHNPISIIIPCHRVIGSNGRLTGYAGGLERKLALLLLESRAK